MLCEFFRILCYLLGTLYHLIQSVDSCSRQVVKIEAHVGVDLSVGLVRLCDTLLGGLPMHAIEWQPRNESKIIVPIYSTK